MTTTTRGWGIALALAASAVAAGCDKAPPAEAKATAAGATRPTATATAAAPARSGDASAEQVAKAARGGLACPAKTTLAPRAADAPVDDAQGVRPGMLYDEAVAAVLCTHPLLVAEPDRARGFRMNTFGQTIRQGFNARFAEAKVERSGQEIVRDLQREASARSLNTRRDDLAPGAARWYVGTMGVPGQERALSVGRDERYAAGQSPTMAATRAALVQKYGEPTHERRASPTQMPTLRWARDGAGRPVAPGTPLFSRCTSHPDPDIGVHLDPDCGIVVEALLQPQPSNPELVDRLKLTIVDSGGGHRRIADTEAALGQADSARRAREVETSATNRKAPTL